ncbi:antitoxin YezG family protein [Nocardiopsis lucentensis]|uniref:hypothetical protein n=1 Tax=Nocardiopsis lucentensis TaxID=53441 RepID=UPI00126797F4|nr:hypothetical protein [Nocardiopsis lucentensis]
MLPKKGHLDMVDQQELLTEIGRDILKSAPENWHEIVYSVYAIATNIEEELIVHYPDGSQTPIHIPHGTSTNVGELRRGMYQEGKGTWFSMKYTIFRPGKFKSEFNYDNPPEFLFSPSNDNYAQELKHFPRGEEHIPEWLREKLREADGRG